MRYALFIYLFFSSFSSLYAVRSEEVYYYSVDITKSENDKLGVMLETPKIAKDEAVFCFPKIVPGTYAIYNFGRFISGFKAIAKNGIDLVTEKRDVNSWVIKNAKDLDRILYEVEDTWDTPLKEDFVFEPAGTNIEKGKNFLLNTHGVFGYFEGMKFNKLEISVTRPVDFYGSTGLSSIKTENNKDIFYLNNYVELVDSPIMYCIPDTSSIMVGKARVLVSVYSPNKVLKASQIVGSLSSTLMAQKDYLGGELPVDKYAFLFYFTDRDTGGSGATGALEHSYSSVYYLPEMPFDILKQTLRDVTAHEFFHIITPLTIHSEEIGDFSFNSPKMSQHLWMYEGCTEYAAGHMQVKAGLIERDEYIEIIRDKMQGADEFKDDLPFTTMSKGCLDEYKKDYNNVYQKGALIGMCLDIWLRNYSGGHYGTQDLMQDLGKKYGKNVSFRDDTLFSVIEKMTYPEIGNFFKKHVAGKEPLPFAETFKMVGLEYYPKFSVLGISYGNIDIGYNPNSGRLVVAGISEMDDFGKALGFLEGDELVSFNGSPLTVDNIKDVISGFIEKAVEGKSLKVQVFRNKEGKMKKVKLKAKIRKVEITEKHILFFSKNASERQVKTRDAWLGKQK